MAYPVISKIRMLGRWQSNRGSWHLWLHSLPGPELGGILAVWGARLPLDGFQAKAGRLIPCNHMQPTLLHTVAVCRGNQLFNLVRGCPWCMATKLFRIFRVAGWTCSWIKTMQLKSPLGSKNPDANGAAVHTDFRIDVGFCAAGCFWPPWKRLEIRRQRNEVEQRHEMATCMPLKQKNKKLQHQTNDTWRATHLNLLRQSLADSTALVLLINSPRAWSTEVTSWNASLHQRYRGPQSKSWTAR